MRARRGKQSYLGSYEHESEAAVAHDNAYVIKCSFEQTPCDPDFLNFPLSNYADLSTTCDSFEAYVVREKQMLKRARRDLLQIMRSRSHTRGRSHSRRVPRVYLRKGTKVEPDSGDDSDSVVENTMPHVDECTSLLE